MNAKLLFWGEKFLCKEQRMEALLFQNVLDLVSFSLVAFPPSSLCFVSREADFYRPHQRLPPSLVSGWVWQMGNISEIFEWEGNGLGVFFLPASLCRIATDWFCPSAKGHNSRGQPSVTTTGIPQRSCGFRSCGFGSTAIKWVKWIFWLPRACESSVDTIL